MKGGGVSAGGIRRHCRVRAGLTTACNLSTRNRGAVSGRKEDSKALVQKKRDLLVELWRTASSETSTSSPRTFAAVTQHSSRLLARLLRIPFFPSTRHELSIDYDASIEEKVNRDF